MEKIIDDESLSFDDESLDNVSGGGSKPYRKCRKIYTFRDKDGKDFTMVSPVLENKEADTLYWGYLSHEMKKNNWTLLSIQWKFDV